MNMSCYITGTDRFPYPLSAEDEAMYLIRYSEGDMEARNVLLEHNLRLVAHIAKKYSQQGISPEELISIGTIGLIKALESYDMSKGIRLGTYSVRCINNEVLMYLRGMKKHTNESSMNEPVGIDKDGNEISIMDTLSCDDEEIIEDIDKRIQIGRMLDTMDRVLTKREKKILDLRYGLHDGRERTQKEVGIILKISRSYVSRIEKSALEKIRAVL